jgi:hypothetical protein
MALYIHTCGVFGSTVYIHLHVYKEYCLRNYFGFDAMNSSRKSISGDTTLKNNDEDNELNDAIRLFMRWT